MIRALAVARAARSAAASLVLIATWACLPGRAWALCPNCLGQQSALTPTLKLIGIFLAVPFAVAAAVYLVLRRALHGRWLAAAGAAPSPGAPPSASSPLAPPSSDGGTQDG